MSKSSAVLGLIVTGVFAAIILCTPTTAEASAYCSWNYTNSTNTAGEGICSVTNQGEAHLTLQLPQGVNYLETYQCNIDDFGDIYWNGTKIAGRGNSGEPHVTNCRVTETSTSVTRTVDLFVRNKGGAWNAAVWFRFTVSETLPPWPSINAWKTVLSGGSTRISWTTKNAEYVSVGKLGNFNPSGSVDVKPTSTTQYVLTASSPASSISGTRRYAYAYVTVYPPQVGIFGQVFEDRNRNGQLDSGEPLFSGRPVSASSFFLRGRTTTVTTNAIGAYAFTDLNQGVPYDLYHPIPEGYTNATELYPTVTLSNNQNAKVNFGVRKLLSISGVVFEDTDGDGQIDAGESRLAGRTVSFKNGTTGNQWTVRTDSNGQYTYDRLSGQSYIVSHAVPDGYVKTTPDSQPISLGYTSVTHNFGVRPNVTKPDVTGDVFAGGSVANLKIDASSVVSAGGTIENVGTSNTVAQYSREAVEETATAVEALRKEQALTLPTTAGQASISGTFNVNPKNGNPSDMATNSSRPEGGVWYVNGNLAIGTTTFRGRGTIIVDGDVRITPRGSIGTVSYATSDALVGIISRTGTITIEGMSSVVGAYYAPNGTISIGNGTTVPAGLFVGKSISLGTTDIAITYDGRITKKPPPGFSHSLVPTISEVAP